MPLTEVAAIDTTVLLALLAFVVAVWALLVALQRRGEADSGRLSRLEQRVEAVLTSTRQDSADQPSHAEASWDVARLGRLERRVHELVERQQQLESRVHDVLELLHQQSDRIEKASSPKVALDSSDPVVQALRNGSKIEAIRRYRERTGVGLKEAKDAVEAIERDLARR